MNADGTVSKNDQMVSFKMLNGKIIKNICLSASDTVVEVQAKIMDKGAGDLG